MARWEDLAWPLFLGAWALHDHMAEQARADRAEARLVVLDAELLDMERGLSSQHAKCVSARKLNDPPDTIELWIISALDDVNRLRMIIANVDVPERPERSQAAGPDDPKPDSATDTNTN